jgi:hypothetical protein
MIWALRVNIFNPFHIATEVRNRLPEIFAGPPSCFAHSRFAGLARASSAKQDADGVR